MILTFARVKEIDIGAATGTENHIPMPWKYRPYHSEITAFTLGLIAQFGLNRYIVNTYKGSSTAHRLQAFLVHFFADFPERPNRNFLPVDDKRQKKIVFEARNMFVDISDRTMDQVNASHLFKLNQEFAH